MVWKVWGSNEWARSYSEVWACWFFTAFLDANEASSVCRDNGHMSLQMTPSHASFSIWLPDIIMNKDSAVVAHVAYLVAGDFKSWGGKKKIKNWPQTVLLILVAGFDWKRSSHWETLRAYIMRNTAWCAWGEICQLKTSQKPDGVKTWKLEQTQKSSQASQKVLVRNLLIRRNVRLDHTFQKRHEDIAGQGSWSKWTVHKTLKSTIRRSVFIRIVALGHRHLLGILDSEIERDVFLIKSTLPLAPRRFSFFFFSFAFQTSEVESYFKSWTLWLYTVSLLALSGFESLSTKWSVITEQNIAEAKVKTAECWGKQK